MSALLFRSLQALDKTGKVIEDYRSVRTAEAFIEFVEKHVGGGGDKKEEEKVRACMAPATLMDCSITSA